MAGGVGRRCVGTGLLWSVCRGSRGSGVWKERGKQSLCGSHLCAFKAQHLSGPGTPMFVGEAELDGGQGARTGPPGGHPHRMLSITNVVVKRKEGNELSLSPS